MRLPTWNARGWPIVILLWVAGGSGADQPGPAFPEPTPTGAKSGLIPRRVLFDNPDRSDPKISPDGKYLSYLAPVDRVMNVWVAPIDKPNEARAITQDKKRGIRAYFWAYTNDRILYPQDVIGSLKMLSHFENGRLLVSQTL